MLRLETDCAPSSDFVVLHLLTQGLNLYGNNIGDDGMRYLADAFAKGALPALEYAPGLGGNPASDAAQRAVKDAFASRSK